MKVLWSSNSPFCTTGYGQQTACAAARLKSMGHDVAILAFYGLEGSKVDWGEIPIYPNDPRDWGLENAKMFMEDFKAEVLITLVDVWVERGMDPAIPWVPWTPVDHNPIPPLVVDTIKHSPGLLKPIAMTRYGQEQMKAAGIESYYIPHSVDTNLFAPNKEVRDFGRNRYGWSDKFVIGTVATNHSERKNYVAMLKGVKIFSDRHPGEVVFYMHTKPHDKRGIDLNALRFALGLEKQTFFPSLAQMTVGVDRETMVRTYNVLDVFLLPSKGEGFGIPIVEAQACGVPAIITKCTGQEELMGGGWYVKDLSPVWTAQGSWQFDCHPEEVAERLEEAYQAKKDGSIAEIGAKAREFSLQYDDEKVYSECWPDVLADIEKRLKAPKNMEGVQNWRLAFIPLGCVPRKVLDLGCGITQPYRKSLERLGEYVGVDIREGTGVTVADAECLPFPNKSFGFVWCSEMLEHVNNPVAVVNEARRVGLHGVILFSTPQNPYFRIDPEHKVVDPKKVRYTQTATGDGLITW